MPTESSISAKRDSYLQDRCDNVPQVHRFSVTAAFFRSHHAIMFISYKLLHLSDYYFVVVKESQEKNTKSVFSTT